ncbi:MAG: NAD(P)H-hydrate dehydratase [Bacteroidetes bacterium]|nr:NAD(P)H-hydrate dehydratase [Bacteroidota bacterium]
MKLLTAQQIRMADSYTIANEPVKSVNLMERAAEKCFHEIKDLLEKDQQVYVFAGTGNNGGDGLAIARMLHKATVVHVFICGKEDAMSADCKINFQRLKRLKVKIKFIKTEKEIPVIKPAALVIDAMFGIGLNKPLDGIPAAVAANINKSNCKVVSVDIPSGLFADEHTPSSVVTVKADYTLTFQQVKRCMLFSENESRTGRVKVLDIGLDKNYMNSLPSKFFLAEKNDISNILLPRKKFSHKGTYGRALLLIGSKGKAGASVLAAKGCIRAGAGLTTAYIPDTLLNILQTAVPEAMCICDNEPNHISTLPDMSGYTAIGAGPGLGTHLQTADAIATLLKQAPCPLILDADALNCISQNKKLLKQIPEDTILTPHLKEFERIFGKSKNDFERNDRQLEASVKYKVVIILKGAYTSISTADGKCYYNTTGNPGLAKGGSGDVLTGVITALRAQGYNATDAAITGVYIHGMAADLAVEQQSDYSLTATELTDYLGKTIRMLMGR